MRWGSRGRRGGPRRRAVTPVRMTAAVVVEANATGMRSRVAPACPSGAPTPTAADEHALDACGGRDAGARDAVVDSAMNAAAAAPRATIGMIALIRRETRLRRRA